MLLPNLRLRYDSKCGLGHIMRCRTLEKAWNRLGGYCLHGNVPPLAGEIVVFDDYYTLNEVRHACMMDGNIVVSFAEFPNVTNSHIVINHNLGAETFHYSFVDRALLGTKYFMLRDEIKNVRVSWGGGVFNADSVNRNLTPEMFAQKLASASVVICSAGLTAYESVYLGKPTLIRCVAENQKLTHTMLLKQKWAYPADETNVRDAYAGKKFDVPVAHSITDGNGADRVAKEIHSYWKERSKRG